MGEACFRKALSRPGHPRQSVSARAGARGTQKGPPDTTNSAQIYIFACSGMRTIRYILGLARASTNGLQFGATACQSAYSSRLTGKSVRACIEWLHRRHVVAERVKHYNLARPTGPRNVISAGPHFAPLLAVPPVGYAYLS